ncbi:hypothetical protein, partial [Mycobacterium intracellulare]
MNNDPGRDDGREASGRVGWALSFLSQAVRGWMTLRRFAFMVLFGTGVAFFQSIGVLLAGLVSATAACWLLDDLPKAGVYLERKTRLLRCKTGFVRGASWRQRWRHCSRWVCNEYGRGALPDIATEKPWYGRNQGRIVVLLTLIAMLGWALPPCS